MKKNVKKKVESLCFYLNFLNTQYFHYNILTDCKIEKKKMIYSFFERNIFA